MGEAIAKVLFVKIGKVVENNSLSSINPHFLSGIKKYPVEKAYLGKRGFVGDEQADTLHHGGETKALLFFSMQTYKKLNELGGSDFKHDNISHYGENIVADGIDENSVCIGDIFKIGDAEVEISQPRQPCWKLSANTKTKAMTSLIYKSGATGWYARVLKEGEIKQNDNIVLLKRVHPELSISTLNRAIVDPQKENEITQKALCCETLGRAFHSSLEGRSKLKDAKNEPFAYHNEPN